MRKILVFINVVLAFVCLNNIALSQSANTSVEDELKKFEIGGHFTFLRRSDVNIPIEVFGRFFQTEVNPGKLSEFGVGARFTYNFTKNIAIEAEASIFPDDKMTVPVVGVPIRIFEPGGRKFQTVFGPKIGLRKNKFGIFGKFRPGLISFDRYEVVTQVGPPTNFFVFARTKEDVTFLNIDVGGVFEYYPSRKTVFRVDVGDTIIRYGAQEPKNINPTITRHNLQINLGFGFRF